MSLQITTSFVQQFGSNVYILAQQRGSRLRNAVRNETIVGEKGFFDQLGATTAVRRTSRYADTPLVNTPHARRMVVPIDYDWADLVDDLDQLKNLIDPTSPYAMNAGYAMGRAMDEALIEAFDGTAYTGKDGTTSTVFDTNMSIAHGSAGLSIAKLRDAKRLLDAQEVDPMTPRYIVTKAQEIDDLLGTTEVTSSDYNTIKALVKGEIDTFMGFKFLRTELLTTASSVTSCFAWAETGMLLGVGKDASPSIDKRPDKNNARQVYVNMSIGATRMSEKEVVRIYTYHA